MTAISLVLFSLATKFGPWNVNVNVKSCCATSPTIEHLSPDTSMAQMHGARLQKKRDKTDLLTKHMYHRKTLHVTSKFVLFVFVFLQMWKYPFSEWLQGVSFKDSLSAPQSLMFSDSRQGRWNCCEQLCKQLFLLTLSWLSDYSCTIFTCEAVNDFPFLPFKIFATPLNS